LSCGFDVRTRAQREPAFARNEAPIVHELAHIVAGYDSATGHWTQEGFASFVQDRFGSNAAYPTFRTAHELARHFAAAYGKPADALIAAWEEFLERPDGDAARARAIYDRNWNFSRGRMGR
jgi:hypothetical protein